MPRFATLFLLTMLTACARAPGAPSSGRVQEYGPGTYFVTYSSVWGPGRASSAAIRDAKAFCAARGSSMQPKDQSVTSGSSFSFSLVFSCSTDPVREGGVTHD